jgi:hypothetical protein
MLLGQHSLQEIALRVAESRGLPQHPDDGAHQECLVMRYGLTTDREWPFLIDGKERRIVELLRDFSSGDTGLQIVYPATQAQPRRCVFDREDRRGVSSSATA